MGFDASGEAAEAAAVGRRQGLISLAAATMTFAGMSPGEADALEDSDCLECGGSGVVACALIPSFPSPPFPLPPPSSQNSQPSFTSFFHDKTVSSNNKKQQCLFPRRSRLGYFARYFRLFVLLSPFPTFQAAVHACLFVCFILLISPSSHVLHNQTQHPPPPTRPPRPQVTCAAAPGSGRR